ncbi:MAG: hypothetical protein CFE44_09300 [Burkholderiales bacterium PBB4]|nr:MAG: hypothetical protein CFE44_09300 [Burkholderiales bacterium PBB4]
MHCQRILKALAPALPKFNHERPPNRGLNAVRHAILSRRTCTAVLKYVPNYSKYDNNAGLTEKQAFAWKKPLKTSSGNDSNDAANCSTRVKKGIDEAH